MNLYFNKRIFRLESYNVPRRYLNIFILRERIYLIRIERLRISIISKPSP